MNSTCDTWEQALTVLFAAVEDAARMGVPSRRITRLMMDHDDPTWAAASICDAVMGAVVDRRRPEHDEGPTVAEMLAGAEVRR